MISFSGAQFPKDVILYAVFFYVRYGVSYRDLEEIFAERNVKVDHSTLNRWVIKYSSSLALAAKKCKRAVATSWRMDESVLQLSCIKDEGWPLGIALQEEISNHHKLH
jgi:putative transposase